MRVRNLMKLGLALVIGAAIAFPVGMIVGGRDSGPVRAGPAAGSGGDGVRNVFSPSVRGDPWFLDRQREGVEALERHCAQTGETCPEARAARRRLAELEAAK